MAVSFMKPERIIELMSCPLKKFRDPTFIVGMFPGEPGSSADEATMELLHVRRLVEESKMMRRAYCFTMANVLLTAMLVVVTAINVWINWGGSGGPEVGAVAQGPAVAPVPTAVQFLSEPIPVRLALERDVYPGGTALWDAIECFAGDGRVGPPRHIPSALRDLLYDAKRYTPDPSIMPLLTEMAESLQATEEDYKTGTYARRQELEAEREALARRLVDQFIAEHEADSDDGR